MLSKGTSLLIVEEHDLLRQGIETIFKQRQGFDVVASVSSADQAIDNIRRLSPEVVVIGPHNNGAVCQQLTENDPDVKILLLVPPGTQADIVDSLRNGASGCLLTDVMAEDLIHAIRLVAQGQVVLPRSAARQALCRDDRRGAYSNLTIRELEVLQLMANGLRNKEIAAELCLSEVTVKTHVSHVLHKLEKTNRTAAILHAHSQGWVDLPASHA